MKVRTITPDKPFRGGCRGDICSEDKGIITASVIALKYVLERLEYLDDVYIFEACKKFSRSFLSRNCDKYDSITFRYSKDEDK